MTRRSLMKQKQPSRPTSPVSTLLESATEEHRAGRLSQAEFLYRRVLQIDPENADALHLLGAMAQQIGKPQIALELVDRALRRNPRLGIVHNTRGVVLHDLKRYREALESYREALRLKPDYADAYCNLGRTLIVLNDYPAALASCDQAIRFGPENPENHDKRADALLHLKQYQHAIDSYDRAIQLNPRDHHAHHNRGVALYFLGRWNDALESLGRAILLKQDYSEAYSNRSTVLIDFRRFQEARDDCDRAIRLNPSSPEAHRNRGVAYMGLNRYDLALGAYERALALKPDYEYLDGALLYAKRLICNWESLTSSSQQLEDQLNRDQKAISPFSLLAISGSPALQKKAAEIYVLDKYSPAEVSDSIVRGPEHDKIRIGYYSADFREHPVSRLMAGVLEHHDKSRFEILGFSYGVNADDSVRTRVSQAMNRFVDVNSMSDADVARLSRELGVDIAVDLTGMTTSCRTGIFARRAAPVQVNYLGFPATMGAGFMDYLIADDTLIPETSRQYYSEKIVYLPDCFQANDSTQPIAEKTYTRAEVGLPESGFVFCCFNNNYKIAPDVFDIWMRILQRVEGSVLWLLDGNPWAAENLRKEAIRRGVDPARLVFTRTLPLVEHLARQRLADLFLDTLPFNAGATASPALWSGLPLLTRMGESFAGRMGASLLRAIDLPELVATTPEGYEELAVELGTKPGRIQAIKERLQRNRLTAPLFDTVRFTKNLEAAYIAMYARSQANLPPEHIHVQ